MENGSTFTRRETLQGMLGVAVAMTLPAAEEAEGADRKTAPWPVDLPASLGRKQPFCDGWRFFRGDAAGAADAAFDDSGWRPLDVPHDWSIEDLPASTAEPTGAIWADTTNILESGPFDMYASQGQGATGWTVGGVGWYRKAFANPQVPAGGKAELRFEGVYMNCDVWVNGQEKPLGKPGERVSYTVTKGSGG